MQFLIYVLLGCLIFYSKDLLLIFYFKNEIVFPNCIVNYKMIALKRNIVSATFKKACNAGSRLLGIDLRKPFLKMRGVHHWTC